MIFFITFISLIYVYQQNEIFYLAYSGGKRQAVLSDLLDANNILRYNINKCSSLTYLDEKILRKLDFELPAPGQLVKLEVGRNNANLNSGLNKRTNLIFSFFSGGRQAQAQTLNNR